MQSPDPYYIEPLFTRDPALISEIQVLMAMMAIKGIYAEYGVQRLNHGIGFDTAAIELLLPTYAESLGLKGKICRHWALNPHPALIPAIEAGFIESRSTPSAPSWAWKSTSAPVADVFAVGPDGSMRSNRALCQAAGHYACDMFIGSTLQIDHAGQFIDRHGGPHRRVRRRVQHGRRRPRTPSRQPGVAESGPAGARRQQAGSRAARSWWCRSSRPSANTCSRPFVDKLDAWELAEQAGFAIPPVMIYGDDVTHILTEEGIANLLLCRGDEEREQAIRGVAGYTAVGPGARTSAWWKICATAASSSAPKTWVSTSGWPRATCWQPAT